MKKSPMSSFKKHFVSSIIISISVSLILITTLVDKQRYQQNFLSLKSELNLLSSKISLLECHIKKINHELQNEEEDVARMEKMILENEESISSLKNKIDSVQSSIFTQWKNCWRPASDGSCQKIMLKMSQGLRDAVVYINAVKTDWMPILRNQMLNFIYNLKPHFDFLTAETVEAYHASKKILLFIQEWIPVLKNQMLNFISNLKPHFDFLCSETFEAYYASKKLLLSHAVKLQRSATPFMQELHKYAKPYMNQIATAVNADIDTALARIGTLIKKISLFLRDLWIG